MTMGYVKDAPKPFLRELEELQSKSTTLLTSESLCQASAPSPAGVAQWDKLRKRAPAAARAQACLSELSNSRSHWRLKQGDQRPHRHHAAFDHRVSHALACAGNSRVVLERQHHPPLLAASPAARLRSRGHQQSFSVQACLTSLHSGGKWTANTFKNASARAVVSRSSATRQTETG